MIFIINFSHTFFTPSWINCHNAFWHCFLWHTALESGQKSFLRRQHNHAAYVLEQQERTLAALNTQLTRFWKRAINSQDCKSVFFFFLLSSLSNKHYFFVSLCHPNVVREGERSEVDLATLCLPCSFGSGSVRWQMAGGGECEKSARAPALTLTPRGHMPALLLPVPCSLALNGAPRSHTHMHACSLCPESMTVLREANSIGSLLKGTGW